MKTTPQQLAMFQPAPERCGETVYNVAQSLPDWARARVDAWTPEQRNAIEQEFARRVSAFHGERIRARSVHNQ